MKAIVGLGNPGKRFEQTRHNLGFWVVDALSRRTNISLNKKKCRALIGEASWAGEKLLLIKPQTYMNCSGESTACIYRWWPLELESMLVVYDDLALPPGTIRLRRQGSAGGHRGMQSIIDSLESTLFPRLRLGIGPVPEGKPGAGYVLAPMCQEEQTMFQTMVQQAADAALDWFEYGIDHAMQEHN